MRALGTRVLAGLRGRGTSLTMLGDNKLEIPRLTCHDRWAGRCSHSSANLALTTISKYDSRPDHLKARRIPNCSICARVTSGSSKCAQLRYINLLPGSMRVEIAGNCYENLDLGYNIINGRSYLLFKLSIAWRMFNLLERVLVVNLRGFQGLAALP
jgi:hypothetical protein